MREIHERMGVPNDTMRPPLSLQESKIIDNDREIVDYSNKDGS